MECALIFKWLPEALSTPTVLVVVGFNPLFSRGKGGGGGNQRMLSTAVKS